MQQHRYEMVSAGMQAKELTIQHMRKPGQRMPVALRKSGKRPNKPVRAQAALDLRIFGHIGRVIQVNETITQARQKHHEYEDKQQKPELGRSHWPELGFGGLRTCKLLAWSS